MRIKQKNARILWNVKHENGKEVITDFIVAEFEKGKDSSEWPMHLYKTYHKDIGNCNFDGSWEKSTPGVLNLIFFGTHDYEDQEHRDRIFKELMKIEEYYNEIMEWRKVKFSIDC